MSNPTTNLFLYHVHCHRLESPTSYKGADAKGCIEIYYDLVNDFFDMDEDEKQDLIYFHEQLTDEHVEWLEAQIRNEKN